LWKIPRSVSDDFFEKEKEKNTSKRKKWTAEYTENRVVEVRDFREIQRDAQDLLHSLLSAMIMHF
jgi:hypothetical protein